MPNLEELKNKYGTIHELTVPLDEDGNKTATIYLRKLDRKTYQAASKVIQRDELDGAEVLIKNLWVDGDDVKTIIDNFDALRAASIQLVKLLTPFEGSLKKV